MKHGALGAVMALLAASACDGPARSPGDATPETVRIEVATRSFITNAPLYLALREGFFADEGLDVHFQSIARSTAKDLPALAQGDLDAIAGAVSIGLFNAIAAGAPFRIVADKGHLDPEECGHAALVARSGLFAGDASRSPAALAGKRMAVSPVNFEAFYVETLLGRAGLSLEDVEISSIQPEAALDAMNRERLDLVATGEPWVTRLVDAGHEVFVTGGEVVPGFQTGVLVFGPSLLEENREAGRRFVRAYLRGVRQFDEGKTPRNLELLAAWTQLDVETLDRMCWPTMRTDGRIDVPSLLAYQRWAVGKGHLERVVEPAGFWDPDFTAPVDGDSMSAIIAQ